MTTYNTYNAYSDIYGLYMANISYIYISDLIIVILLEWPHPSQSPMGEAVESALLNW